MGADQISASFLLGKILSFTITLIRLYGFAYLYVYQNPYGYLNNFFNLLHTFIGQHIVPIRYIQQPLLLKV